MIRFSSDPSGRGLTTQTALSIIDVYSCVRVLCGTIGSLPINLCRDDGTNGRERNHPLYRLLHKQPNSWQTAAEFQALMVHHLALAGNFYAQINRVLGEVKELNPIQPAAVEVSQNEDHSLTYLVAQKDGSKKAFRQGEILHVKGLLSNGIVGENVVSLLAETFGQASDGEKYQGRLVRNGAKPSGVLAFPDKLNDEQYKKQIKRIEAATSGDNTGGTLVLDGAATFLKVSLSSADIELLATMKLKRSQICGALGVPPHMIGDLERATFSNIEQQDLGYYKHSIAHWLRQIEQCLDRDLLQGPEKEKYAFKFNPNALLRGDVVSRFDAHTKAIMFGMRSPDECRALEDEAARADGFGGQYFYPANLLPAEMKPQQGQSQK